MIPVTLFKNVEESTLKLCEEAVEKIEERRRLFERQGQRISTTNSGSAPVRTHKPQINVAIIDGTLSESGSRGYTATLCIYITVVSTSPKSETQRRDELYPVLTVIMNRLLGANLTKDGKPLPISPLKTSQTKWGQSTMDGEGGFLSYTLVLETSFLWSRRDGEPDENYDGLPWLEGIDMLFDKMPENEEVLQAKTTFSKEV